MFLRGCVKGFVWLYIMFFLLSTNPKINNAFVHNLSILVFVY